MTRTALFVIGIMAVSIVSFAQERPAPPPLESGASQADVDKALSPRRPVSRTRRPWSSGSRTSPTTRSGRARTDWSATTGPGFPQQQPFSVQCTSIANLDRVAQNLKAEAAGDRKKSEAMLSAQEKDGTRVKPEYGSMWHSVAGPDPRAGAPAPRDDRGARRHDAVHRPAR